MSVAGVTYDFLSSGRSATKGGATARVHAALREAIVLLDLKPGEFLDKQAIATRLGVSRFPVGEAMNRLAAEGLVDIIPQSGSRVALIKISDARENMFLRRALEIETVRRVAATATPSLAEQLNSNLRYQQAAIEAGRPQRLSWFRSRFPRHVAGPSRLRTRQVGNRDSAAQP